MNMMFESPGSILAFLCATFPFVLMWMYERFKTMLIHYGVDTEYFAFKFMWFIAKLYVYFRRRLCKMTDIISQMLKITSNKNLLLIKDGNIVKKVPFEKIHEYPYSLDYDMVWLEYCAEDSNMVSKYKTHMIRKSVVDEVKDYFDVCDTSFMGINVTIKEGSVVVNKETIVFGSENYYVVGNILFDRHFIKYWMIRQNKFEMKETHTYEVSFFDSSVTHHNIKEPEYVQITNNGFDVIRPNIVIEDSIEHTDETEWEVEPEKNLKSSVKEQPQMPEVNLLGSYFKGNTNWSEMFNSKNQ
jgi:hypothetical protein